VAAQGTFLSETQAAPGFIHYMVYFESIRSAKGAAATATATAIATATRAARRQHRRHAVGF
jgi:hypothetical protein